MIKSDIIIINKIMRRDTKFFTNQEQNTLYNKFAGIFDNNPNIRCLDILVGYFHASGYFQIRKLLENIRPIRILVGINIDQITLDMQTHGILFNNADKEKAESEWQDNLRKDINQAGYDKDTEDGILQFVEDINNDKVQIKAHPAKNIHAKIYIMRPENFNEHSGGHVITGSSNLTETGLGTAAASNYEFNVLLNDYSDAQFASDEFERLWMEGIDISKACVNEAIQKTYLQNITPRELYLKMLIEYFGDEIEFDPNSIHDLPKVFKRLDYQLDAVNQAYKILEKHNGCFLADVVGLGKTVIATLIARLFYQKNGYPDYRSKILLIVPPAIRENWEYTLKKFEMDDPFKIFTSGSTDKITDHKSFDMVIIDESHKFRNDTSQAYINMQQICKTPTKKGVPKKVLLLSATPLNNRPKDLRNQILLFQDGNQSTLNLSLYDFFNGAQKVQDEIRQLTNREEIRKQTQVLYEKVRNKVIEPLMVRRTRTDLEETSRYKDDLKAQGIKFPNVKNPKPIYYKLPPDINALFDKTVKIIGNKDGDGLRYTRYRAIYYLAPEKKQHYVRVELFTNQLVGMMRTLLLKRMDSSFIAFKSTLDRFLKSSETMLKMIENDAIYIAPHIKIEEYILNDREDELEELLTDDPAAMIYCCDDFEKGFSEGVKHDHKILQELVKEWRAITQDPKLAAFNKKLDELLDTKINPEQKLIIFTESRDTMVYLEQKLKNHKNHKTLGVDSNNIHEHKKDIKANFDATAPAQKSDYDILITTNVLAEGINLHRANVVVNYDTPWNTTILMQRIGRVNRIGSDAENIYIYNFHPTEQVDEQIQLEQRAQIKMQAFHSALGEDSPIYMADEEVSTHKIFNPNIQAEKSVTLPYLEEIRQYRLHNYAEYYRLKNMPAKVRNAVNHAAQCGDTLSFMRTEDKHTATFSLIDHDHNIANISFIEAAQMLGAHINANATTLPPQHHQQVMMALAQFKNALAKQAIEINHNINLSPADKGAINFIKALQTIAADNQKIILDNVIRAICQKKYQQLSRDITKKIIKSKFAQDKQLATMLAVINKYNIAELPEQLPPASKNSLKPTIIISQSYV